jgi:hypothetical protein
VFHHSGVFVEQRLTFRAIGNDRVGFAAEFDVSREPASPRPDDTGSFDFLNQIHAVDLPQTSARLPQPFAVHSNRINAQRQKPV